MSEERIAALLCELEARAAGYWRIDWGLLALESFVACAELPDDVAREFSDATREVPLALTSLGIVQAALDGEPVISRAAELPPDYGSGRWLRAFGAARSVAVPVRDEDGALRGVLSVALAEGPPDDRAIAEHLREFARGLVG